MGIQLVNHSANSMRQTMDHPEKNDAIIILS